MSLVDRAKNIIVSPKTEWAVVAAEVPDKGKIVTGYVIPLALIGTIANFIGYGFVGAGLLKGMGAGIAYALMSLLTTIVGVYISSAVINALAPSFNSEKDAGRAMQLVAYASTPGWVAAALNVVPVLGVVAGIAALYGIYLFYLGLPHTMKTPQDKVIIYMIVSAVVVFLVYMVLAMIFGAIILGIFGLGMAAMF